MVSCWPISFRFRSRQGVCDTPLHLFGYYRGWIQLIYTPVRLKTRLNTIHHYTGLGDVGAGWGLYTMCNRFEMNKYTLHSWVDGRNLGKIASTNWGKIAPFDANKINNFAQHQGFKGVLLLNKFIWEIFWMLLWSKVHSVIIPFCTFAVYFERERLQKISDDTTESGCFRMIERSIDMPSGCYDANSLLRWLTTSSPCDNDECNLYTKLGSFDSNHSLLSHLAQFSQTQRVTNIVVVVLTEWRFKNNTQYNK